MRLTQLVGNTPLLDLSFFSPNPGKVSLCAKAEWLNPGGSLKDRPVLRMLTQAIESGDLYQDKIILDSSSGNAGISYSMIGAALGYKVNIVLPGNASKERKQRLLAHGAQLIQTDPLEGYDAAVREARNLARLEPERFFFCDQYGNQNNVLAHYHGTANELIKQVKQAVTHLVIGVGTGGSLTGIAGRLKQTWPNVKVIAVRPERWPGIEGLKPLGEPEDIVPDILQAELIDEWLDISCDEARSACHLLAKQGYFVGLSSGAYFAACLQTMAAMEQGLVATIFCDLGERYFSAGLWDGL